MNHDIDVSARGDLPSLRTKLLEFLQTLDLDFADDLSDETPLVGSGLLDSLALIRLAAWIEGEIGRPLDPDAFDLQEEWKTVGKVLDHIRRHRSSP
jgi:acyl carrier protein